MLTDLEIEKEIAAICDVEIYEDMGLSGFQLIRLDNYERWHPLTDDALCFQFCYGDDIRVSYTECPAGSGKAYWAVKDGMQTDYQPTPNRAVCLAKLNIFSEF